MSRPWDCLAARWSDSAPLTLSMATVAFYDPNHWEENVALFIHLFTLKVIPHFRTVKAIKHSIKDKKIM